MTFFRGFLSTLPRFIDISHRSAATSALPISPMHQLLVNFRAAFQKQGFSAFIVPLADPHLSEYIHPHFNRMQFLSGFTGSAGTALVTENKAFLFTDGRYFIQAEKELDSTCWELMKMGEPMVPSLDEYLLQNLPANAVVGIDSTICSNSYFQGLHRSLQKRSIQLSSAPFGENAVDIVWKETRPPLLPKPVRHLPLHLSGRTTKDKLEALRVELANNNARAILLSSLDEIAWLFNFRGRDVAFNQVAYAYALVTRDEAKLFLATTNLANDLQTNLKESGVSVHPYSSAHEALVSFVGRRNNSTGAILLDGSNLSQYLYSKVPAELVLNKTSPIVRWKAVKNPSELAGMAACHVRDAVAVIEFLALLDEMVSQSNSDKVCSEWEVGEVLSAMRQLHGEGTFLEESFPTIAGVDGNGAIVHYRAKKSDCGQLTTNSMLLLDSGGQYIDGTTDITRTVHTGLPTSDQIEKFTRVLKGHIRLATVKFPAGTAGCQLDALARLSLWDIGKDFNHGTGHGVGAALNVHEGPQSISKRLTITAALEENMIVSIEPGYYQAGDFGIRIENLYRVVPSGEHAGFLEFAPLAFVPIQRKLIDKSLLSTDEAKWLDAYHQMVDQLIYPKLSTQRARDFLDKSTAAL